MDFIGIILMAIRVFVIFFVVMNLVPLLIYLERKVVAQFQMRLGPNRVGPAGVLQPIADAIKLMMKEDIMPAGAERFIYTVAPMMAIIPAILACVVIPFGPVWWTRGTDLNHSVLFSLALSSLSVYAITLGGWASNNKYSLMGALRASAQMISYEMGMGLAVISLLMVTQTLSLSKIVEQQHLHGWNILGGGDLVRAVTMWIAFGIYIICGIAETNRAPFDLAEAESELVAGFHTEYSSFKFAMFFMAEYINMIVISALATTLFFGGWSGPGISLDPATGTVAGGWPFALLGVVYFLIKVFVFLYVYFWIRASLPRFRYDQLMNFGWKRLVPLSLANIFLVGMIIAWRGNWF